MNYLTTKETAELWGISDRRVLQYCNAGRIEGAEKKGDLWLIPADAEKPVDKRYNINRKTDDGGDNNER